MKYYLIFYFSLLLFSCERNKEEKKFTINYALESLNIPISKRYLNSYQVFNTYQEDNKNKFVSYNRYTHSLNFFNLESGQIISELELEREGPSGINEILSLYFHNRDSIFIYERGYLHLMNLEGKKFRSFSLYELFDVEELGEPNFNFYFKLNFNQENHSSIFYLTQFTDKESSPKIASLNLKTMELTILPVKAPIFLSSEETTGFISYLGFVDYWKGEILYNFQYQSAIFLCNPKDGKIKEFSGNSEENPSQINLLNINSTSDEFDTHAIENTNFLSVMPDKWRNLVYRFKWNKPSVKNNERGFLDKQLSVEVFDQNLRFISEILLPDYKYQINNFFVNENGLYINVAHPKNPNLSDDFLSFHLYKFSNNYEDEN